MTRLVPTDPKARAALVFAGSVAATLVLVMLVFPAIGGVAGVPAAILFQGLVLGLITSLTTVGIVLIYRSLRVINFAQLALGAAGASLCFQLIRYVPRVPFAVAVILGLAIGIGTGVLIDLIFGRRFANSPRLVLTVVTIVASFVVSQALIPAVLSLPFLPPRALRPVADFAAPGALRPYLPFRGFSFGVGGSGLRFGFPEVFALELSLAALLGLGAFLRYTKVGVALRAVADNSERAALLGVGTGIMGTLVWAIAGGLAAAAAILSGFAFGPSGSFSFNAIDLTVPLLAAVIARFRSIPTAVVSAVLLSVITLSWQYAVVTDAPLISTLLLAGLIGALVVQRRGLFRSELAAATSWQATEEIRPIPKEFDSIVGLKVAKYATIAALVAGVLSVPWLLSTSITVLGQVIALGAIVAVSLVVLAGWAGQVSLGQYGFVAMGCVVGGGLIARSGLSFWLAVPVTVVVCAAFSLVIGLPALRVRGLFLGVVTFVFSVAATDVLFNRRYFGWLLPTGAVARPTAFVLNFNDERSMYYLCVGAFLLTVVIVANLRRSRLGRLLIAVRENEANVQSLGVGLVRTKLLGFAISGALCGFAGVIYATQLRAVSPALFGPSQSFLVFTYAVLGGITSIVGVLLGVAYFNITGYAFAHNFIFSIIAGSLPLILLFVAPAGLVSLLTSTRDGLLRIVAQRRHLVVPSLFADYDPEALSRKLIPLAEPITGTGLAALHSGQRFDLRSRLYGKGAAGGASEPSAPLVGATAGGGPRP